MVQVMEATRPFSVNDRAGAVMGYRPTNVVAIDQPCELGFRCPVCKVPARTGDEYDERLHWSEYVGFLWCQVCNKDYPSVLCVDLDADPDPERDWVNAGVDAAIRVFLDQVEEAKQGR